MAEKLEPRSTDPSWYALQSTISAEQRDDIQRWLIRGSTVSWGTTLVNKDSNYAGIINIFNQAEKMQGSKHWFFSFYLRERTCSFIINPVSALCSYCHKLQSSYFSQSALNTSNCARHEVINLDLVCVCVNWCRLQRIPDLPGVGTNDF